MINRKIYILLLSILLLGCVSKSDLILNAKTLPGGTNYKDSDALPFAPELIKKVLPNGLTYYVRANGNPGNRAVMFLLVNTGSANESNEQAGYAHFVEHMAFNGTESFPENELVNFLRSIGMEFGAEVNATTDQEKTLYTLTMPVNKPGFFDTGLKVLREWATKITFDPTEVENEKGVILAERRSRISPDERARVKEMQGLLANSDQADRDPIGTENSIKTATADGLKNFFLEHYRPDRMAIIVVGDIDAQEVATKIEKEFSFSSVDGKVQARPIFKVEPTKDLSFVSSLDKEFEQSIISYRKVVPYKYDSTISEYKDSLIMRIATIAIQFRFNDLSKTGTMPWNEIQFGDDYFYGGTRLYAFAVSSMFGKELESFTTLAVEIERLRRFGFIDSEFKRTVANYRKWLDSLDVEDNDLKSWAFAEEYVRNYMYNEPVPGVINERVYIKDTLDHLTIEQLNDAAKIILASDEGFVAVRAKSDDKKSQISEQEFEKALRSARAANLTRIKTNAETGGLFENMPVGGSIVSEKVLLSGLTELILSNGARVILKPTKYDNNAIKFSAWSSGGYINLQVELQTTATLAPYFFIQAGLGTMSYAKLDEELAGRDVGLQWGISADSEILIGNSNTKEIETLLRLIYLFSSEPGRDASAFNIIKNNIASQIDANTNKPQYKFEVDWSYDVFSKNPRMSNITGTKISAMDFTKSRNLLLNLFNNASDFTYIFVGDFDINLIKPLIAKHIGAIDKGKTNSISWIEPLVVRQSDKKTLSGIEFKYETENKATLCVVLAGQSEWSREREIILSYLGQVLNKYLLDTLREKMGATYFISLTSTFTKMPLNQYMLTIKFDCETERVYELSSIVKRAIKDMVNGKIDDKYFQQIKALADRNFTGKTRTNDFWVSNITAAISLGNDFDILNREKNLLKAINRDNIEKLAKELFTDEQCFVYMLNK